MVRSDNSPLRIEPKRGKVTEHGIESSGNKEWAILHEDVSRSNFADDAGKLRP
jgi:predicted RNA methylase